MSSPTQTRSVWKKAMESIRSRIIALDGTNWISPQRIKVIKYPIDARLKVLLSEGRRPDGTPAILITQKQETNVRRFPGSARRLEYPVIVVVTSGNDGSDTRNHDRHLYLRELIGVEFDQQPAVGVDGIYKTEYQPGALFPESLRAKSIDAQAMTILCHACERVSG